MLTLSANAVATLLAPLSRDRVIEVTVTGYAERNETFTIANGTAPYWNGTAVQAGTLTIGNTTAKVLEPMTVRVSSRSTDLTESASAGSLVEAGHRRRYMLPAGAALYVISASTPTVAVDEVWSNGLVRL